MIDSNSSFQQLIDALETLPPKAQQALSWMSQNRQLVEELTEGDPVPLETLRQIQARALQREDYLLFLLALYQEKREQEKQST